MHRIVPCFRPIEIQNAARCSHRQHFWHFMFRSPSGAPNSTVSFVTAVGPAVPGPTKRQGDAVHQSLQYWTYQCRHQAGASQAESRL